MAVKIRLKRMGKIRTPFYRIVVADSRTKRDGRVIEEIGTYNPKTDPSLIRVDSERAQHWLSVGAQPSEPVLALLRKTGDWQRFRGEPAPPALLEPAARVDRLAAFNAALEEAHGTGAAEGVTAKRTASARRTARPPTEPKADQARGEPAAAESAAAEPTGAEPAAAQPDGGQPDGAQPDGAQPDVAEPALPQPQPAADSEPAGDGADSEPAADAADTAGDKPTGA